MAANKILYYLVKKYINVQKSGVSKIFFYVLFIFYHNININIYFTINSMFYIFIYVICYSIYVLFIM